MAEWGETVIGHKKIEFRANGIAISGIQPNDKIGRMKIIFARIDNSFRGFSHKPIDF